MQVILSNPKHPEYGQVTIPLPLPRDQYDDCVELLKKLEIGSATEQDCQVMEISSAFPALKRLEMLTVNLDDLDYHPAAYSTVSSWIFLFVLPSFGG